MTAPLAGDELPRLATRPPGATSRALVHRLSKVESPNITALDPVPIVWVEARGAAVRDADDNIYIDLTAGFGVANAGHAHPAVASAIAEQASRLAHGLGDVFPTEPKLRLLERLAEITPGDLGVTILGSSGAEAVEAALKTAVMRTGRTGVVAFRGAYHGLTYGALAATSRGDFRAPFGTQLFEGVRFAPYPASEAEVAGSVAAVRETIGAAEATSHPIGAVLVEPILGRGGLVVPPDDFLTQLRQLCDGARVLLLLDEIYTGCGRTGRWFACEHAGVVPDVLILGKALTGSVPLSAAVGTADAMRGWPQSGGEAIHTSTFLGNPIACAAALAQLAAVVEESLLERARVVGERIRADTLGWAQRFEGVGQPRGRGLLQGVPMSDGMALRVAQRAVEEGVLVLAEGERAEVLALTPPAVITDAQLTAALSTIERCIAAETAA